MAGVKGRSGRRPTGVTHARPIAEAEKRIADRLPMLIDRAMELAEGVTVQEVDRDGETNVYTRPPDIKAITYLVDRIMGKARQALEHTGEAGGPMKIIVEYADPEPRE